MINNQQYIFNRQVPKKRHEYEHTMEDADDTDIRCYTPIFHVLPKIFGYLLKLNYLCNRE
jgi:hypothetical protein